MGPRAAVASKLPASKSSSGIQVALVSAASALVKARLGFRGVCGFWGLGFRGLGGFGWLLACLLGWLV